MNYNICIVRPDGYIHSAAFAELAELVCYGLQDLGHSVAININQTFNNATNIIIGCHLLDPALIAEVPKSSIVINTEQILDVNELWNSNIFRWVSSFETWDYSERNLIKLKEAKAKNPKLIRIGFHNKLARILNHSEQDIDVLFYGSINDRRRKIIVLLQESGCNVEAVFGVYGEERDKLIARSKVILNMHYYNSNIFEIVRVFYLMTNSKAVVAEVGEKTAINPSYLDGICASSYENLVESCKRLVADDGLRNELQSKALATIMKLPQSDLIAPLLESF